MAALHSHMSLWPLDLLRLVMRFAVDSLEAWALLQEVHSRFRTAAQAPVVLSHFTLCPARPSVIAHCVGVRHVSLERYATFRGGMRSAFPLSLYFQNLPSNLHTLHLHGQFINGLQGLQHASRLMSLHVEDCVFVRLECIPTLPNLRILIMNGFEQFARFGIRIPRIKNLPLLEVLAVTWSDLTDDHLHDLLSMDKLHTLLLQECLITDTGIKCLARLPALRTLNVSSLDITDASLPHIELCPSLQTVDMSGCTNVSLAGARALSLRNPSLNVIMFE